VCSENRNRLLEAQVSEEQLAFADAQKVRDLNAISLLFCMVSLFYFCSNGCTKNLLEQKLEELDLQVKRLQKDLDSEKVRMETNLCALNFFPSFPLMTCFWFPPLISATKI